MEMVGEQTFWDHLDVLRAAILKVAVVTFVFGIAAFCFKDALFAVVLAPKNSDFVTYRLLGRIALFTGEASEAFQVQLINTGLAQQFILHMKTALCAGVLCASPYTFYQLFRFVLPALYADERRYALRVVGGGYLMFAVGVGVSYYLVFPFTFRFLGTYQVSLEVVNLISLESYISTLLTLCLSIGLVFEMPILAWFFAKLGFLTASFMRQYRKHAVVLILVVAAVITPTSDVFTLLLVALPMYLLYELGICIVQRTAKGE